MHTIQLADSQFKKLLGQAEAAGFEDIASYIEALADEAAFDPRSGMSEDELRQSAAQCSAINERMKSKGGHDAREALTALGKKFGFDSP